MDFQLNVNEPACRLSVTMGSTGAITAAISEFRTSLRLTEPCFEVDATVMGVVIDMVLLLRGKKLFFKVIEYNCDCGDDPRYVLR